jgi:hypothetical protein
MLKSQADHMKSKIKTLFKDDRWLEKMGSNELDFLTILNRDLCRESKVAENGKIRSELRPECNNRYRLYALLRSKRRCPKNEHGEEMLKKMNKEK